MTVREMENRKNWLSVRAQGIGGSDAGAIMGLNKYKGPMAVYLEKTGQVEPEDTPESGEPVDACQSGHGHHWRECRA